MSKKYKFDLTKYYDGDKVVNDIAPILENFMSIFGDDDGVATLDVRNDVHVIVKRDEGPVFHMVVDDDKYAKLPKSLGKARDFADSFIQKMAKAVDGNRANTDSIEDDLLAHINGDESPEAKTTVKVNGKEVTDADEKQKVIDDITKKMNDVKAEMAKKFETIQKDLLDSFAPFMPTPNDYQKFFDNFLKKDN